MGDVSTGIAYLCRSCCCIKDVDVSPDGSHFGSKAKRDPREQQVEDAFRSRDYRRDASGRFNVQPAPKDSMLPAPATRKGNPEHQASDTLISNSMSTASTEVNKRDTPELDAKHGAGRAENLSSSSSEMPE